jgi:hypothetical protein
MKREDDSLIYKLVEMVLIVSVEALHKIGTTTTDLFLKIFGRPIRLIQYIIYKINRLLKISKK